MFHITAKLFLEYLIKFDEYQPLSRDSHEILFQIRTLLSFVPPLNLPDSPKSTSTADTYDLRAILEENNIDTDFTPDLDRALDVIYEK